MSLIIHNKAPKYFSSFLTFFFDFLKLLCNIELN